MTYCSRDKDEEPGCSNEGVVTLVQRVHQKDRDQGQRDPVKEREDHPGGDKDAPEHGPLGRGNLEAECERPSGALRDGFRESNDQRNGGGKGDKMPLKWKR